MSGYPDQPALWLSAAVYRTIADPHPGVVDRRHLLAVFADWADLVDAIVDALVEYGAIMEHGVAPGGPLRAVSYEDPAAPMHLPKD